MYSYDALYEDIVANERIVYTYNMHRDDERMSVSVTTVEFLAGGRRHAHALHRAGRVPRRRSTRPQEREHGTGELLDKLGEALAQGAGV